MDPNSVYGKAKRSFLLLAVLCIATVCISFSDAFAWRGGGYGGGRSDRYYFHSGRYYHPGRLWYDVAVVAPPIGVIVEALPFGYTSFMLSGVPYYYYEGSYFRPCPSGFVVVPVPAPAVETQQPQAPAEGKAQPTAPVAPAQVQPAKAVSGDSVVINVPEKNGGYYPVVLVKRGEGYVGPQGEYYTGHPTVDQLKVLYGK